MNLERIANSNAFEFHFDPSALDRFASIYEDVGDALRPSERDLHVRVDLKMVEIYVSSAT
jgi:hypothetical protein